MLTVIVHQAENYTQDIHWNLSSDWIVHNTPSVYMNRDGHMKAMRILSRTCGASKSNQQVLLFDGHEIHFNDRATHLVRYHHIYPFILKAGDYTNYQPNDNGTNLKLNIYDGIAKLKFQRQHGNMKFTPAHMNYFLVDMWN